MGIQSFTPSAGGSPDRTFINTVTLDTPARDWSQSGTAGYYSIMSATSQAGYAIYTDGTNKTGAPVGKSVYVAHSFNTITIMGLEADQFSLFKVAPKTTSNVANIFGRFTINHTLINSSGNHNFPGTYLPVADVLCIGGGGGAGYHGGGGGGGGAYIYLSKYPMVAVTPVTVAARASRMTKGSATAFGGIIAEGGGKGSGHGEDQPGGAGANGGGATGGHVSGTFAGGAGTVPTNLPYGFTYAGPYAGAFTGGNAGGNSSGSNSNWVRRGGGGGGAGGAGTTGGDNGGGNGGAGVLSPFSSVGSHTSPYASTYFSAGGRGSNHSPAGIGSNGAHWSDGGYGMGGASHHDSVLTEQQGGPGVVIYRSYS